MQSARTPPSHQPPDYVCPFCRLINHADLSKETSTLDDIVYQDTTVTARGDSVVIRIIDVDLRSAVTLLARYLDHPVMFGSVTTGRVTLGVHSPVARVADRR